MKGRLRSRPTSFRAPSVRSSHLLHHLFLASLLLLIFVKHDLSSVHALAPPHPDLLRSNYTLPHDKRRLLSNGARGTFLNPALCGDLSDDECQELDRSFQQQQHEQQRILQTTGKVKTLVILVRFLDHADRDLPSREQIENLLHGTVHSSDIPTGSVNEYLQHNSYFQLEWEHTVLPWTLTDMTEEEYSFGESGLRIEFGFSLHPILDYHFNQGFDFSEFDLNGDGYIDNTIVLHSGYAAEIGGVDCYNSRTHEFRIWSHAIGATYASWKAPDNSVQMGQYMVSPAMRDVCGSNIVRIGVLTHEFLHILGLPDLYDGNWIGAGLGYWDIMANPYGPDASQLYPSYLSPWCKIALNWLEPIQITQDGLYQIGASALSPQVYRIDHNFPSGEYLLIENRQPIRWDEQLFGGGLLIYHVDDTMGLDFNMLRGYPGQPGWPENGVHYRVALAQADANYDLEHGNNLGDGVDFFGPGDELGPAPIQYGYADPSFYPNTNSYQKGVLKQTGIRIHDISTSGTVMTFHVSGIAQAPTPLPTPAPTPYPTQPPTPGPTTAEPTPFPTAPPVPEPTPVPTMPPTTLPTPGPTDPPTPIPTPYPTLPWAPSGITTLPTRPPTDVNGGSTFDTSFATKSRWSTLSTILAVAATFFSLLL